MTMWLRQSTSVEVDIGPFLDETDGQTPETALTITQPDIRLKKGGAAWAQKNAAQTLLHEENGWYEVTLDATDTNTLGSLKIAIDESGALPVWREFLVVPANVYDSIVLDSDQLQVDVVNVGADVINDTAVAANVTIASVTGAVGSVTAPVTVGTNNDKTGYALAADVRIKKNTALAKFPFAMVDSVDHVTPKTGLTVSAQRSLDGVAFASCANAPVELSNGVYLIDLAASDLNADTVCLKFTATGADARIVSIITQVE